MKLRTLPLLIIAITLTACSGHKSALSSLSSSFSISESSLEPSSITPSSSEDIKSSSVPTSSSQISSSDKPSTPAYDGYYNDLTSWSNGEELKTKLNVISHKTYKALNYTAPNYQTNINADHSYYDFEYLDVIYSETDVYKNETNKGWQREHAFCASLMCGSLTAEAVKRTGRATDFHNLLAASASANSSRGNKNYGNADKSSESYQNRTTQNGKDGYSFDSLNFEPADKDKGRVARAIFYMAMMYKDDELDEVNNVVMKGLKIVEEPVTYVAGDNGAFAIGNLSTLLDWNKKYPVDYLEMQHNISVYQDKSAIDGFAQGNRNPFVDYPSFVDYVYGENKDKQGNLNDFVSSESILNSQKSNKELSHYALKEAKRSYEPGSQIQPSDYKIVKVLKNYDTEVVNDGYTNSLANHTFSTDDGEAIDAIITAGEDTFKYRITLNPLATCSSGEISLSASGINKGKKAEDQEVVFGNEKFILNFDSSANISSSNTMTITNINQDGSPIGVTLGSNTKPLTKFVFKTKESYKVDAAYIKCFVGNTSSSYSLTIKVGDSVLFNTMTVNNKDVAKVYGTSTSTPLQGQVTYIFTGSTSLKINSIAFNEIIL